MKLTSTLSRSARRTCLGLLLAVAGCSEPLPTGEECEQYTDEASCRAAGCTIWMLGTRSVSSGGECSPPESDVPICWMNADGESQSGDLVTTYTRQRADGSVEVVTLGSDRGTPIGWTRCEDQCPCIPDVDA